MRDREASLKAIQALNFDQLRQKACLPKPEGEGWTKPQALEAEKWYKRYLSLMITHPNIKHVPNGPIDTFWHRHILDTSKYIEDCQNIFGGYVHHYPYYGLNGEEDATARDQSFEETNQAYQELYGEECTTMGLLFDIVADPEGCEAKPLRGILRPTMTQAMAIAGSSCNNSGSGTGCSRK